jgi:putative hemolysin
MDDVPLLIALIVLLVLSAFFSCSETAFTSLSHVRLERLSLKSRSAKVALFLEDRYERLLSAILIGNNIANIGASTISTLLFVHWVGGDNGPWLSTIIITVLVLIFGEIGPKNISKAIPEKMAMMCAYPMAFFYFLFFALSWLFDKMTESFIKLFRIGKKEPTLTEDELKMVISDIKDEGVINQSEHDLLQKSITFDDKTVSDIMTKWDKTVKAYTTDSDFEIKQMFEVNNYSRVPYIDKDSGEVLGFLLQKDFYEMLLENNASIESIIKDPLSLKAQLPISDAFKKFQHLKQQVALVVDEDNSPLGIISMEDILEELVGEIEDEYDAEDEEESKLYKAAKNEKDKTTSKKNPGLKKAVQPTRK